MPDNRLPKKLLFGELQHGKRSLGGPKKRYKDTLKGSLKSFLPSLPFLLSLMLGHGESSAGSYLADPTSPIPCEYVNPYIPTQSPEEDWSDHMQNHQADSPLFVWPHVWSADLHLLIKSMVIHDTECPYWDQVSLNNTNQSKPNPQVLQPNPWHLGACSKKSQWVACCPAQWRKNLRERENHHSGE